MHILSIDQFNEKLTVTPVSLSDLKSVKIDKAQTPAVSHAKLTSSLRHLIDGYAYAPRQFRGRIIRKTIDNNPNVTIDIDDDTRTIYLENKCHVWSMTLTRLYRFSTDGYRLKFGDDDIIQINSGGQDVKLNTRSCIEFSNDKYISFADGLSPLNKLREINFYKIGFDNTNDISHLTSICHIDTISFIDCTFDDDTIYDSNTILPHTKHSNINLTSINPRLSKKLKESGWK